MIFQEKTVENGYEYKVEDVFGVIVIESDTKLTGEILDDMVVLLLRQDQNAEVVKGEVKHDKGVVRYTFTKEPQWSEVSPEEEPEWEEDYPCENTPTSTSETVSVFTRIYHSVARTFKKLRRFVVVLRKVWRNLD